MGLQLRALITVIVDENNGDRTSVDILDDHGGLAAPIGSFQRAARPTVTRDRTAPRHNVVMRGALIAAISLPDGTLVRGRGRREPVPSGPLPDFGLYLGGRARFRRPPAQPSWPAEWIDWPDFGVPRDPERAAASIVDAFQRARSGQRVEVVCDGGTGRTGTVIACMSVLAGHPADDAVAWTRRHYRPRAVETPGQRRWVGWFAAHIG